MRRAEARERLVRLDSSYHLIRQDLQTLCLSFNPHTLIDHNTYTARRARLRRALLPLTARVHPRPGAVRAPTGGSGHFMALQISTGAGKHACIEGALLPLRGGYVALGGLEAHVGDLGAISTRILESRSRRDRLRASRPPKAVATYLSVRSGSWTYDLRPGNYGLPVIFPCNYRPVITGVITCNYSPPFPVTSNW